MSDRFLLEQFIELIDGGRSTFDELVKIENPTDLVARLYKLTADERLAIVIERVLVARSTSFAAEASQA